MVNCKHGDDKYKFLKRRQGEPSLSSHLSTSAVLGGGGLPPLERGEEEEQWSVSPGNKAHGGILHDSNKQVVDQYNSIPGPVTPT